MRLALLMDVAYRMPDVLAMRVAKRERASSLQNTRRHRYNCARVLPYILRRWTWYSAFGAPPYMSAGWVRCMEKMAARWV